jgi:hypothetical protein
MALTTSPSLQSRFDEALGDQRAQGGDQKRRREQEVVVGRGIDAVGRIDDARCLLGQPRQQRIQRAKQQVGTVAAGHAGERGGQAGQRVPPDRLKHDRGQRNEQHVADFPTGVRHHAREDDSQRQRPWRSRQDDQFQRGGDEPAALRHGDAEHRDQHRTERGKAREVGDQLAHHPVQAADREQAHGFDDLSGAGMYCTQVELRRHGREQDHEHRHGREERRRMGQRVAAAFDDGEKSGQRGRAGRR